MTGTINLAFDLRESYGVIVIPTGDYPAAYTHPDGEIETHMRIESAEIKRPEEIEGDLVVRLAGPGEGGNTTMDLILSPEAAERIGMALIRASALPIGDPARPSNN
jgi:hypothetical protein